MAKRRSEIKMECELETESNYSEKKMGRAYAAILQFDPCQNLFDRFFLPHCPRIWDKKKTRYWTSFSTMIRVGMVIEFRGKSHGSRKLQYFLVVDLPESPLKDISRINAHRIVVKRGRKDRKHPMPSRFIDPQTKYDVMVRDKKECVYCGSKENIEFDHVIPVAKGGSNSVSNIQLLCRSCNRHKSQNVYYPLSERSLADLASVNSGQATHICSQTH
jgi:5-methylcytosine-specific restriction endonuclease McrA